MKRKVGLFGGSFDPVHRGHLALAQYLLECGAVEEVWLMVSPLNPLKSGTQLSPDAERLEMARLAAADVPGVVVSDFELHLPRPSYTWRTLRALREAHPDIEFSLIVGADNWLVFDRWQHPEEILAHHRLLVYPRPGCEVDESALPDGVVYVHAPLLPFSSTQVREAVRRGEDISEMVPRAILERCVAHYQQPAE